MKKSIILILVFFTLLTTTFAQSETCVCLGDINRDGEIDSADAELLVELILSGEYDVCGDVNEDGVVNLLDLDPFDEILESGVGCDCLCLGDVNGDGEVNLLDIDPFRDIIISGGNDSCADINGDGQVNLLDIAPFVDLVTSGRVCGCVCLGDLNDDGLVNLLDVSLFVAILEAGGYDGCADIDGDGDVDLLDLSQFVDIIQNGGGCGEPLTSGASSARSQQDTDVAINNLYKDLDAEQSVSEIVVFPNPVSNTVNIQFKMIESTSANLSIYNSSGQQVYSKIVPAVHGQNTESIDISTLAPGLYFVEIGNRKGKFTVKK